VYTADVSSRHYDPSRDLDRFFLTEITYSGGQPPAYLLDCVTGSGLDLSDVIFDEGGIRVVIPDDIGDGNVNVTFDNVEIWYATLRGIDVENILRQEGRQTFDVMWRLSGEVDGGS
jgi:hypothetical protein